MSSQGPNPSTACSSPQKWVRLPRCETDPFPANLPPDNKAVSKIVWQRRSPFHAFVFLAVLFGATFCNLTKTFCTPLPNYCTTQMPGFLDEIKAREADPSAGLKKADTSGDKSAADTKGAAESATQEKAAEPAAAPAKE